MESLANTLFRGMLKPDSADMQNIRTNDAHCAGTVDVLVPEKKARKIQEDAGVAEAETNKRNETVAKREMERKQCKAAMIAVEEAEKERLEKIVEDKSEGTSVCATD